MKARSAILLIPLLFSCNGVTGAGKYIIDCTGDQCLNGGPSANGLEDSGTTEGNSSGGTVLCPAPTGKVVPACTAGEFSRAVRTGPADDRTILAPSGDQEAPYTPNCMIIKAGQTVTWSGNLTKHPLINRENSSPGNPIQTYAGTEVSFTFDCPGDYNFSCRNHQDSMLGTIRVQP